MIRSRAVRFPDEHGTEEATAVLDRYLGGSRRFLNVSDCRIDVSVGAGRFDVLLAAPQSAHCRVLTHVEDRHINDVADAVARELGRQWSGVLDDDELWCWTGSEITVAGHVGTLLQRMLCEVHDGLMAMAAVWSEQIEMELRRLWEHALCRRAAQDGRWTRIRLEIGGRARPPKKKRRAISA